MLTIWCAPKFRWLDKEFGANVRRLRIAYLTKAMFAFVLIVLAIAFGSELGNREDVAAVIEWVIAFGFTFYLITFWFDLRASKGFSKGELKYAHGASYGEHSHPTMRQY